jgi:hypothetical protein
MSTIPAKRIERNCNNPNGRGPHGQTTPVIAKKSAPLGDGT